MHIGIDIGGVIVDKTTRLVLPDAIMSIRLLIDKYGTDSIFIISKAKDKWVTANREMLDKEEFYNKTGFDIKNLYFVDEYEDKKTMCDKLKIDYMIDDSIKVIRFLLNTTTTPIWFDKEKMTDFSKRDSKKIIIARSWKTIRKIFQKLN